MRVDAVAVKANDRHKHAFTEVVPDATSAVVENLSEKTEYLLTVTAITNEYFEQLPPGHELKGLRTLSQHKAPKDDMWLPSSSVIGMTSGTDPAADVSVVKSTANSVSLKWKPPVVYGSNRLQGTVVRWAESRLKQPFNEDSSMVSYKNVTAEHNEVTIVDLQPGVLYKFCVEAVVSVKTTLESDSNDPEYEKQNRRTTHVMSKPVLSRTRAPCEPPKPIITGYTTESIHLYWERPLLWFPLGRDNNNEPQYLKLSLEGYRLEINGKPHMRLSSSAQSCTLVKCKPGKTYNVVLIALTCTEEVKRDRKKMVSNLVCSFRSYFHFY